jgi:PhnB protein
MTTTTPDYVPQGFHTISPYLVVEDPGAAIAFYARAFGAREILKHTDDKGRITHAEIMVGDSPIMMSGGFEVGSLVAQPPAKLGGSSLHLYLYVPDSDALFAQAIAAGAREVMPMADQSYGDRMGGVLDPFGHMWWLATFKPALASPDLRDRATRTA